MIPIYTIKEILEMVVRKISKKKKFVEKFLE
jgi:hypothetical protein